MSTTSFTVIGFGERRSFQITFGLLAGYGRGARVFHINDAKAIIHDWMVSRIEGDLSYVTGHLLESQVVYAWQGKDRIAGRGDEPGGVFQGEVSVVYDANQSDEEVVEQLNELGAALGAGLDQTRVYVSFGEQTWVLERQRVRALSIA